MRKVIQGFFHQLPHDKSLFIRNVGRGKWEITCNWYEAATIIKHLSASYPQYTFTLNE